MAGYFITFEGGEGAGKTTLRDRLAERLTELGHPCLCTREPGGTEVGQALRSLLLQGGELAVETELLLYAADRAEHVASKIGPALQAGQVVLCDRFTDSTVAYQGYGRQLDLAVIEQLNRIATGGLTPHLTLWLDLPVQEGLQRARVRAQSANELPDRLEQAAIDFHERLHDGFRQLAMNCPGRIQRVDASQAREHVFADSWAIVAGHFPTLSQPA
ncbi:MAG: dTMP kinase [Cyanobacteria bacterium P01_E01_bin.34]